MATPDTLTVIRARGRRLAKLIRANGTVEGYDNSKHFDLFTVSVVDLRALNRLLLQLLHRADCAVVRGAIADPVRVRHVRRLAFPDYATADQPTLVDVPHHWVALDIEGVDRPDDVPAADLPGSALEAVRRLPKAFYGAGCLVQATASHGIKPGCRLRLWYWLDRPTTGDELTRWLHGKPADPSVFRTAQPIYTASPVFEPGARDHLPHRLVMLPGAILVPVPLPEALRPQPLRRVVPMPSPSDTWAMRYAFAALTKAATRVRLAEIGDRHRTILREAQGLARFVSAGLLSERDVGTVLHGAGEEIGKSEREVASMIAWAIAHPSWTSLPAMIAP